jgi:hypothetical protein
VLYLLVCDYHLWMFNCLLVFCLINVIIRLIDQIVGNIQLEHVHLVLVLVDLRFGCLIFDKKLLFCQILFS